MNYPPTIKHLFAPLGARLYMFESKIYLYDSFVFISPIELEDKMEAYYNEDLMLKIGRDANAHDPIEVIDEAKQYAKRVHAVMDDLEPRRVKAGFDNSGNIIEVELSEDEKDKLFEKWKTELMIYKYELQQLQLARLAYSKEEVKKATESEVIENPKPFFTITGKLGIKEFGKDFEQKMTLPQVALLIHYLKKNEIMPPYEITSISLLTKYFFARSYKVREHLDPIDQKGPQEKHLADIRVVRETIDNLLKSVDTDIDTLSPVKK